MLLHPRTTPQYANADVASHKIMTPDRRLSGHIATRADEVPRQFHTLPENGKVMLPARPTCPLCFAEFSSLPGLSTHLSGGHSKISPLQM